MDGDHVMRVVRRARHDALGGACLGEGMLKHAVVLRRGPEASQHASEIGGPPLT